MEKNVQTPDDNTISRKDFIKKAAIATAGFYIVPRYVLGGKGFTAPSDKLYIAAVGTGGEAENDIHHFATHPKKRAEIAFLCDVDERPAAARRKEFPKAKFYHDWREMFDKEHKNFDAVTVAIPDHNHAIVGLRAMQLHKHLYLQKPLTHDIYEARIITEASKKYNVVTQMGDQGSSCEGMRTMREWFEAGLIGDITKVYCWTDRPVWPQGISWPSTSRPPIPKELNWDLWLGTAQNTNYIENLVPFNWRGWWEFGTGALGDMGCHIMGPPFKLLGLGYPTEVSGSASTVYKGIFKEGIYPESGPVSSSIKFKFKQQNGKDLDLFWMDGGITPERLTELDPDVNMNDALGDIPSENDFEGCTLFIGTKGKVSCGWGGSHPRLLPLSLNKDVNIPKKYPRIEGDMDGHWWQWVDASIAGAGKMEVDSPFEGYAGPLTETVLMGNLLLRTFDIQEKIKRNDPVYGTMESLKFSGRYKALQWDGANMRVTNYEPANQFIKREYRKGWGELKL
ncbi:MAG: Gfo/Idh/MocA family protein [Sphingobacteriales bacterium]